MKTIGGVTFSFMITTAIVFLYFLLRKLNLKPSLRALHDLSDVSSNKIQTDIVLENACLANERSKDQFVLIPNAIGAFRCNWIINEVETISKTKVQWYRFDESHEIISDVYKNIVDEMDGDLVPSILPFVNSMIKTKVIPITYQVK